MTRECARPGCKTRIKPIYLMCPPDWREVPEAVQQDLLRTMRAFEQNYRDPVARQAYQAAKRAAIESVTPC